MSGICECRHSSSQHRWTSDTVWDNDYSDTDYTYWECKECSCKEFKETKTVTITQSEYNELKGVPDE